MKELSRRVVLRIAADNLDVFFGRIGEIDEISDYVGKPLAVEHPFDHVVQGIDSIFFFEFVAVCLSPCIVEL